MRVVELRRDEELAALREAWNQLADESASRTIFLTWEWMAAWWAAYGKPGALRILMFVDDAGALRGIAPLHEQHATRYGQTVPVLSFIGDGSIAPPRLNDSDYLDFIIAPGYEGPVIEALQRHCSKALEAGTVLLLNEIPSPSPNLPHLAGMAASEGLLLSESDVPCATVRLPETWDEYLALLQPRFRTKVRSVLRNLENRQEMQFRFCTEAGELERLLPALFDLHTRRWQAEGKPGVFGGASKRDFYGRLSRYLLEQSRLRLSWLEWKGRILACQYGFEYGGAYFQLQEGYEPASEHWNLGIGLRAWSIRHMLREGVREYDFLGGAGRHKTNWAAGIKNSKRLLIARPSHRNILFCRGPEWDAALRDAARNVLPERVVAAVRKIREPRAAAAESGGYLRQATAGCYFHLGLPAIARPVRERYRFSLAGNGSSRKLSWERRTGPAARILYYHRVNNDNDPFFTAISTGLFEEHMRHLSRHYQVVSLTELLRRLDDGNSRETVVAVTFDDGYRDNYENAFPILARYGVPATIFLATGNLDSGEPLWFEQLAEAVKKTSRESIDLESEIPRRFWLRTPEERLEANGQIFAMLRGLAEKERQQLLTEVLRQLVAPAAWERSNRMLTWDQVRLMNSRGIDFGGHTVTHPFLSRLSPAQAAWEVTECKRRIEQEAQTAVRHFAYPNGRSEDFTPASKQVLRAAGYEAAVTTIWGVNDGSTERMELRRGGPWENSAALFAYKLDWYQLVNA